MRLVAHDALRFPLEGGFVKARRELAALLDAAPPGPSLDAPCGTGLLRPAFGPRRYTGLDHDPASLARARRRGQPDDAFVCADLRTMPFDDQSFAVAVCHGSLHHFDDAALLDVVRELARVASHVLLIDLVRDGQSPLQRTLYDLDAGGHVRFEAPFEALASEVLAIELRRTWWHGVNRKRVIAGRGLPPP